MFRSSPRPSLRLVPAASLTAVLLLALTGPAAHAGCSAASLDGLYTWRGTVSLTAAGRLCNVRGTGRYDGQGRGWEETRVQCPDQPVRTASGPVRYTLDAACQGSFMSPDEPDQAETHFRMDLHGGLSLQRRGEGYEVRAMALRERDAGLDDAWRARIAAGARDWDEHARRLRREAERHARASTSTSRAGAGSRPVGGDWKVALSGNERAALVQQGTAALAKISASETSCKSREPFSWSCQQFEEGMTELTRLCGYSDSYCQMVASIRNRRGWAAFNE